MTAVMRPNSSNPTASGSSSAVQPGTKVTASTCSVAPSASATTTSVPSRAGINSGVVTEVSVRSACIQASSEWMACSE